MHSSNEPNYLQIWSEPCEMMSNNTTIAPCATKFGVDNVSGYYGPGAWGGWILLVLSCYINNIFSSIKDEASPSRNGHIWGIDLDLVGVFIYPMIAAGHMLLCIIHIEHPRYAASLMASQSVLAVFQIIIPPLVWLIWFRASASDRNWSRKASFAVCLLILCSFVHVCADFMHMVERDNTIMWRMFLHQFDFQKLYVDYHSQVLSPYIMKTFQPPPVKMSLEELQSIIRIKEEVDGVNVPRWQRLRNFDDCVNGRNSFFSCRRKLFRSQLRDPTTLPPRSTGRVHAEMLSVLPWHSSRLRYNLVLGGALTTCVGIALGWRHKSLKRTAQEVVVAFIAGYVTLLTVMELANLGRYEPDFHYFALDFLPPGPAKLSDMDQITSILVSGLLPVLASLYTVISNKSGKDSPWNMGVLYIRKMMKTTNAVKQTRISVGGAALSTELSTLESVAPLPNVHFAQTC